MRNAIGAVLVMIGGMGMDSESMLIPVLMVLAGLALIATGGLLEFEEGR